MSSFAEAYHWPLDQIFKLTIPQIVMLNHASHINHKRMEARIESNSGREKTYSEGYIKNLSKENPYSHLNPDKGVKGDVFQTKLKEFDDPTVLGPDGTQKLSELSTDFEKLAEYLAF